MMHTPKEPQNIEELHDAFMELIHEGILEGQKEELIEVLEELMNEIAHGAMTPTGKYVGRMFLTALEKRIRL